MALRKRLLTWLRSFRFRRDRLLIREQRSHFPRVADDRCSMTRFRKEMGR